MEGNFVYILISAKDSKTYTGSTDNLYSRLAQHEKGQCQATKDRRPLKLAYIEEYSRLADARQRERYLKTSSGRRLIKKLFNESIISL